MSANTAGTKNKACRGDSPRVCKTVAIIGGGFSGAMVAAQLLRRATKPLQIKLIERAAAVGRGVAFGTHYTSHVLNARAGEMSAFPDDPEHFVRMAVEERGLKGVDGNSFVPRKTYGQYIEHILSVAVWHAHPDVTFDRIAEEAVGIDVTGNEWAYIKFANGSGLIADKVVLAIGNLPPADPPIADDGFYQSHRYFSRPWSDGALRWLFPDEPVLLLGSGLTCVDITAALREQGHRGLIHVVSRHGLFPHVHRLVTPDPAFLTGEDAHKGLRWLVHRVRQEASDAVAQGRDWRSVVDALRPVTRDIWVNLSLDDKRRFLRHLRPYWEAHRHRCAPGPFQAMTEMLSSGQLVLHAGRVARYTQTLDRVEAEIDRRMKAGTARISVSRVINCTGPLSDYRKLQHPLMHDLLTRGAIKPDDLNQGLSVTRHGNLIDVRNRPSRLLFTLGPPTKGTFWETTAVHEIRVQAAELAKRLLL